MIVPLVLKAQGFWGYGLNGGLQGCGHNASMGTEASSYKEDLREQKKQISDLEKDRRKFRRELNREKNELRKYDTALRTSFNAEAYSFVKNHFDNRKTCRGYKGFEETESKPRKKTIEEEAQTKPEAEASIQNEKMKKDSRKPAAEEDEESVDTEVEPKQLFKEWGSVCSLENNPRAQLKPAICSKSYLQLSSSKVAECKTAIVNYPSKNNEVLRLKAQIEATTEAIKAARDTIKDDAETMREEAAEARRERMEEIREGGICYSCLAGGSSSSLEDAEPNWGGVLANGIGALMAYKSTDSFYGNIADKNARLGMATQVPMVSPFMAATPYVLGAIGAGLGQGGFGCAGNAGGIAGMGGSFGPYAALGGMGQVGGAFGTPQWALGGALGGGAYLPGATPWGLNGPWPIARPSACSTPSRP